jgi:hypothetical protein
MPQPEPIITIIATALIQCMIRTGQGCSRGPSDAKDWEIVTVITPFSSRKRGSLPCDLKED